MEAVPKAEALELDLALLDNGLPALNGGTITNSPYGLPTECHSCHLQPINFFCALSQESADAFQRMRHPAVFPGNAVILLEGQPSHAIAVLCRGQAKLSTLSRDGKAFIMRIAKPGEILGLHAVITGKPHELTAQTMQPCQLCFVESRDFLRFLKEHGDATLLAAQQISRDCQDAYNVVRSIGLSNSVTARIAKFMLASATDGQASNGAIRTRFTLTHEDIAQLMGTTRETISRILSGFRKQDIMELKGSSLVIHNKFELERLAA